MAAAVVGDEGIIGQLVGHDQRGEESEHRAQHEEDGASHDEGYLASEHDHVMGGGRDMEATYLVRLEMQMTRRATERPVE